jgi:DNA primase
MTFNVDKLDQIPINEIVETLGGSYKMDKGPGSKSYNMRCCNGAYHKDGDKKPSLTIWTNKNYCQCHVCGIKGHPINLTMMMLNADFKEACKWLHETFSIPYKDGSKSNYIPKTIKKPKIKEIEYDRFNKSQKFSKILLRDWFEKYSTLSREQKLKMVYSYIYRYSLLCDRKKLNDYYASRKISNKHLEKIGFLDEKEIPNLISELLSYYPIEDLVEFDIINDSKHKFPLSWKQLKNCLVIPSFSIYTDLIEGFMLRPIDNSNGWFKAKEKRVSKSEIIKPLAFGFGYKILSSDCDIYITEGHIDALSLPEEYCFIAAPGVNALEHKQLGLLRGKNIKLVFDQDEAGLRSAWGYYEVSFLNQKLLILKNQKEDLEGMKNIFKIQNIEFSIFEHKGLKDKLLEAGAKSVNVICWDKNLGKDINELLKRGHDVQKIIQRDR